MKLELISLQRAVMEHSGSKCVCVCVTCHGRNGLIHNHSCCLISQVFQCMAEPIQSHPIRHLLTHRRFNVPVCVRGVKNPDPLLAALAKHHGSSRDGSTVSVMLEELSLEVGEFLGLESTAGQMSSALPVERGLPVQPQSLRRTCRSS